MSKEINTKELGSGCKRYYMMLGALLTIFIMFLIRAVGSYICSVMDVFGFMNYPVMAFLDWLGDSVFYNMDYVIPYSLPSIIVYWSILGSVIGLIVYGIKYHSPKSP